MYKKYIVRLTAEEREICHETVRRGSSERVCHAQILLKTDGSAWTDRKIAEAFSCRRQTVENIRRNFVEEGFERALERKRRETPPVPKIRRGGSQGHRHVRGAASERVRQLVVAVAGREGCGVGDRGLHKPRNGEADAKKNGFSCKRKVQYWVIPPESDAEVSVRYPGDDLRLRTFVPSKRPCILDRQRIFVFHVELAATLCFADPGWLHGSKFPRGFRKRSQAVLDAERNGGPSRRANIALPVRGHGGV